MRHAKCFKHPVYLDAFLHFEYGFIQVRFLHLGMVFVYSGMVFIFVVFVHSGMTIP